MVAFVISLGFIFTGVLLQYREVRLFFVCARVRAHVCVREREAQCRVRVRMGARLALRVGGERSLLR